MPGDEMPGPGNNADMKEAGWWAVSEHLRRTKAGDGVARVRGNNERWWDEGKGREEVVKLKSEGANDKDDGGKEV